MFLDADHPTVVTVGKLSRDGARSIDFHRTNENGTTSLVMAVVVGTTLSDADYRAIGQAVMAVFGS